MALYKEQFNKFNVMREILVNRYLLTSVLVNINNVIYYLESKDKTMKALLDEETRSKIKTTLQYKDTIQFDKFVLSARYFNALVQKYGTEFVSKACILMDDYLKKNIDKQLSQTTINKRVKEYIIKLSANDKIENYLADAVKIATNLDYKLIDNETLARQYIAGIPSYMRTLDEGCNYLKEKFNL